MEILLTNDDGIFAPGLAAAYHRLRKLGNVTVVAPTDSRSGTGHSVTISSPLVCNRIEIEGQFTGYGVHGSPADCVKLAVMQLHEKPIDLVVAGINNGANIGINVYYSGTVAAAMEGAFLGIPAVAVSLATEQDMDFDKAARYFTNVLEKLMPIEPGSVININVPPLSNGPPRGVKVVPQSTKALQERYIVHRNDTAGAVFELAGATHHIDDNLTDTAALTEGFITVTALAADMTDHEKNRRLMEIQWHQIPLSGD